MLFRSTTLASRALTAEERDTVFSGDFAVARPYFESLLVEGDRAVTVQDRTIFGLCRPERLLDLVRRFTVFEGGQRKIARHQQYFGIRLAMERLRQFDIKGIRKGGVIWHTQGSGKSLTMVMLGRSLALDKEILNPRLIIVTDRDDLDKQIKDTFKSCELTPARATSGAHLVELIRDRKPLITTIINKFDTPPRLYVAGETYFYLGRQYRLKIVPDTRRTVKLLRGSIVVLSDKPNQSEVTRNLLNNWYRDRAHLKFAERLELT